MFHSGVDNYRDIPQKRRFSGKVNVLASIDQFVKLSTTTSGSRCSHRCQCGHEDNSFKQAQKEEDRGSYRGYWQIRSTKIRKEREHRSQKSSSSPSSPLLMSSKTGLLKTSRRPLLPFPPEHQVAQQKEEFPEWAPREYKGKSETSWGMKSSAKLSYQEQQRQKHFEKGRDYKYGTSYGLESDLCADEACKALKRKAQDEPTRGYKVRNETSCKAKYQKSFRENSSITKGFSRYSEKKRSRSADEHEAKTERYYRRPERRPRSLSKEYEKCVREQPDSERSSRRKERVHSKNNSEHSSETEGSSKHREDNNLKCVREQSSDSERFSRRKERVHSKNDSEHSSETEGSSKHREDNLKGSTEVANLETPGEKNNPVERTSSKIKKNLKHKVDDLWGMYSVTSSSTDPAVSISSSSSCSSAASARKDDIVQAEIKQEDCRKDVNFSVNSVTASSKDVCVPATHTAVAALAKSNPIKQAEIKQEDCRKDVNSSVNSVTASSKDMCVPGTYTAVAALAKSNPIKQAKIKQEDCRKDINFGVNSVTAISKDMCVPATHTAVAALAKSNPIKQSEINEDKKDGSFCLYSIPPSSKDTCTPDNRTANSALANSNQIKQSNTVNSHHKEISSQNVVEFQEDPSSQCEDGIKDDIVELTSPVYPDPNDSYSFEDESPYYLGAEAEGLNDRHSTILAKRDEIEQAFRQDCMVYVAVVTALLEQDPSLEEKIQHALRASLNDLTARCVRELQDFIEEFDSGNGNRQTEH